jgi:branched-chain amino acid transport system substrate-binding protein
VALDQDQVLVNRYRIIKLLGQGGFGEVYQAWDMRLEGCCAVKRNLQPAPEVRRQFEQEARMLFKLRHPNLPRVQDYFTGLEDEQYLVMDFVEGEDLSDFLKRTGTPPVEQALAWLEQVCDALTYLHSRQPPVVHRDIKPANIIITPEGQAMLVDFGIAKSDPQLRTLSGARAWTPGFAPPEQYGQGRTDAQSDVYSLGATAYALLTGESPPDAMDIAAGEKEPAKPAHEVNPAVPLQVSRAVEQAMQLSRAQRTRTAAEFRQALKIQHALPDILQAGTPKQQEILRSVPEVESTVHELPEAPKLGSSAPESLPERGKPNLRWMGRALLAVVLLAAVGGLAWWIVQGVQNGKEQAAALQATSTQPSKPSPAPTKAPLPTAVPTYIGELKIAILAPLTGPAPTFGASTRDGALMAIDEWNARGGVLGAKIIPVVEDSQCTSGPAVSAANKVINQDQVHFIIGEVCSLASIPISEIVNKKNVVQISPTSTNPSVVRDAAGNVKPFTFVACFNDDTQGKVMAQFAAGDLGAKKAFVLFDQANDYVKGLAETFEKYFTEAGGTVVGKETYTATDTDFSAILAKVAEANPDVVVLPDYYNIVNLLTRQAKEKGITAPFIGGDGWDSPDLDTAAAAGGYFTNHYSPAEDREIVQNFVTKYSETYKDDQGNPRLPDSLAALTYDSVNMLLKAIKESGNDDPTRVKDILAERQFEGITGSITFDDFHTPIKPVFINAVNTGGIEYLKQINPYTGSESAATDALKPVPPAAPACNSIGQTWTSPLDGMILVCLPAGEFGMGSNSDGSDEKPFHKVYLDTFWIDKTEVTNAMFAQFVEGSGYLNAGSSTWGNPDHPVTEVTWEDAIAYCDWMGRRLPSEAQWEKAARGADGRKYPWGDSPTTGNLANFADMNLNVDVADKNVNDGYETTAPVGSYPAGASPYGALDMAGNVWEWVNDWYQPDYYNSSLEANPTGPATGTGRVLRGGSYHDPWDSLRTSYRFYSDPESHFSNFGFRCAAMP